MLHIALGSWQKIKRIVEKNEVKKLLEDIFTGRIASNGFGMAVMPNSPFCVNHFFNGLSLSGVTRFISLLLHFLEED